MTRLLREHPVIDVELDADGRLTAIRWNGRREAVEVCNRWRVEEAWWRDPIARDYYGFHVWPENLGYVPLPSEGGTPAHIEHMLEAARLHRVVRDAWASFFWHPPLIRSTLGIESLEKLVDGILAQGYEFVSLAELRKRGE